MTTLIFSVYPPSEIALVLVHYMYHVFNSQMIFGMTAIKQLLTSLKLISVGQFVSKKNRVSYYYECSSLSLCYLRLYLFVSAFPCNFRFLGDLVIIRFRVTSFSVSLHYLI